MKDLTIATFISNNEKYNEDFLKFSKELSQKLDVEILIFTDKKIRSVDDIKAFKKYMILYNKYQHQKNEIERKIKNIFFSLFKHINNFLYWIIIKKQRHRHYPHLQPSAAV